jgi:DUF4097 and DUF4098 domain-containing protein YvlB
MKIILKVGILCIIIGAISVTVFGLLAQPYLEEQMVYTDQNYDYEGTDFNRIDLSFFNNPVVIKPSIDSQIHIRFKTDQYEEVTVNEDNQILSIVVTSDWWDQFRNPLHWFNFSNIGINRTVTVELPSALYHLSVRTSNGTISLEDLTLESAILRTSNGGISIENVDIPTITMTSSNGKLYLKDVVSTTVDLETSNGEIELIGVEAYSIDAETSNGLISASGINSEDFRVYTANGTINLTIQGNFEDYKVRTKTSNGTVKINGSTYGNDTYHSSKVPFVEAITSNGNIRINFED